MFSKSHIAHIARVARTRGTVRVRRVGAWRSTCPALKPPAKPAPRLEIRLRYRPRSDFRLRSLSKVGFPTSVFCPKTHHRQRRMSASALLLAVPLTECFLPLTRPAVNPGLGTGLLLSILLWQQDCFNHSCAGNRIAPVHYEQLGLGTVLARAQACDGVGPAVELTLHGGCRRRTLSASGLCCAKEPHFPEKLLRSRTYAQAARHGL